MNLDLEMPRHVARQKESGMSLWVYCKQHGISYHSMQYWKKKLRKLDCKKLTPGKDMFIELAPPSQKETFSNRGQGLGDPPPVIPQVELTFPNGMILKIYG